MNGRYNDDKLRCDVIVIHSFVERGMFEVAIKTLKLLLISYHADALKAAVDVR